MSEFMAKRPGQTQAAMDAMMNDPLFANALKSVRADPVYGRLVTGMPDNSVAVFDAIKNRVKSLMYPVMRSTTELLCRKRSAQQCHVVAGEDVRDCLAVGLFSSRCGSKLLIKLVAPTRHIDDDDLSGITRQVQERVGQLGRKVSKGARIEDKGLIPAPDLEAALEHMDGLFLDVMDMKRRTAVRGDFDDKIVEQASSILAGDFEDQIASWTRLQAHSAIGSQELGLERGTRVTGQNVVHLILRFEP